MNEINDITAKDIKDTNSILCAKQYQQYILNGQIMTAKKYYRTSYQKEMIDNYSSVSASMINQLTNKILKLERDVLNKTQDWALYQEMDETALIGDITFA